MEDSTRVSNRFQCKNSSMYFNVSVYELFGIMFCHLFNHLMTLHVRPVLYSFCIFIYLVLVMFNPLLHSIPNCDVCIYTHSVPKWE